MRVLKFPYPLFHFILSYLVLFSKFFWPLLALKCLREWIPSSWNNFDRLIEMEKTHQRYIIFNSITQNHLKNIRKAFVTNTEYTFNNGIF